MPEFFALLPPLLSGLKTTVIITVAAAVVALVTAFIAGLMRISRRAWVRAPAVAYIDFFRGTSALVQLFWAYYALPLLGVRLDAMTVAIVVLGLNIGAYGAEVVRGAIQSIHAGQWEAAVALNFTRTQTLARIIIPQAVVVMMPTFGNLLVELLKSTALVSLITIGDLTFQGQALRSSTMRSAEIFSLTLALYFVTALALLYGFRRLEKKLALYKG
ncbi:MAG: ectoine/hydroxyectoine ABC transporter permease subunit EhuC [Candidatus Nitrospinota bacterium M3_3B_026]